jgi:hypothetical protein
MRPDQFYILDGKTAVPVSSEEWARWFDRNERHVKAERFGPVLVSTVFLGLDHNYFDHGPPLLFETMVFGGALDGEQERCSTWEEAEQMHADMVNRVKGRQ